MDNLSLFKKFYSKPYFQQGVAAVPAFLTIAATSGIRMKKYTGFAYTGWAFRYKDGYGQMYYSYEDLERLWKIIKAKTKKSKNYLPLMEKKWRRISDKGLRRMKANCSDLRKLRDNEILSLFKESADLLSDSVGIAHIIEPISLIAEKEFKTRLSKYVKNPAKLNFYYAKLTAPSKPSYLAEEEAELLKIKGAPKFHQKRLLKEHLNKYFWIQNTYVGAKKLNQEFFERRMKRLKVQQKSVDQKKQILKEIKLDKETLWLMDMIDLATYWQDRRKMWIQKSIYYLDEILTETARRTKISRRHLTYLSVFEIKNLNSISGLGVLKPELVKRTAGIHTLLLPDREIIVHGTDFVEIDKYRSNLESKEKVTEIRGSIANIGTAAGRVVVCDTLDSLKKVRSGDVIVTSMTRPEYMIAIKKASAIVTDEGGITSHAAIISRELNIPCIIGTKVATRVLKTGDKVEVRANHGFVRILN